MPTFFDTHAHLADEQLADDVAAVLDRARAAGVGECLSVATNLGTTQACIALANIYEGVYASAGIHPNYCHEAAAGDWNAIAKLAQDPAVRAIGETGLDKYWHDTPFDVQQDYFARHIALSRATGKPFIVHMRDCEAETLAQLREEFARGGPLHGVMHSYTGSAEGAAECVRLGLHISFAGMVTYKKSDALRRVAALVPAERLLIETDSPYLSPEPVRDRRPNDPAHVAHTAACLAEVRGISLEQMAALTTGNARRWLGLST